MEITFVQCAVIYVLILLTILCKSLVSKFTISTYQPILRDDINKSLNYSTHLTGINSKNFHSLDIKQQDLFVGHALGYLRLNCVNTLKELNIDDKDSDRLCSILISNIGKCSITKRELTDGFIK